MVRLFYYYFFAPYNNFHSFKELFKNELLMKEYAKKVFEQAEKDKNGLVSRNEFENLVKKCSINDITLDEINYIANQVKDYGSGKMSFKDFLKMFSNLLNYLKKVFSYSEYLENKYIFFNRTIRL